MISIDKETVQKLLTMPVNRTLRIVLADRMFTIIDTEEFHRIAELAGLKVIDAPVFP